MPPHDSAYHFVSLSLALLGGLIHHDFRRRQSIARNEPMYRDSTVLRELRRLGVLVGVLAVLLHAMRPAFLAWGELPLLPYVRWLGALLAAVGLAGTFYAEREVSPLPMTEHLTPLGRVVPVDPKLVVTGLYRYIRHPLYVSFALVVIGIALLSASLIVAGLGVAIVAHLLLVRVPREEMELADLFGNSWVEYAAKTRRFVPWSRVMPR